MCLLWLLLQFIVLVMYWDVPPVSSEEGGVLLEMKREEPREEEAPLMGPDGEAAATSYQAVGCGPPGERPVRGGSSSPFRSFSASRGEPERPRLEEPVFSWGVCCSRNKFRGKFGHKRKTELVY